MASLIRPTEATYVIHDKVTVETSGESILEQEQTKEKHYLKEDSFIHVLYAEYSIFNALTPACVSPPIRP